MKPLIKTTIPMKTTWDFEVSSCRKRAVGAFGKTAAHRDTTNIGINMCQHQPSSHHVAMCVFTTVAILSQHPPRWLTRRASSATMSCGIPTHLHVVLLPSCTLPAPGMLAATSIPRLTALHRVPPSGDPTCSLRLNWRVLRRPRADRDKTL